MSTPVSEGRLAESRVNQCDRQGMADIAAGHVVDLDTALNEPYPGGR
jgi:hypothetical protein